MRTYPSIRSNLGLSENLDRSLKVGHRQYLSYVYYHVESYRGARGTAI